MNNVLVEIRGVSKYYRAEKVLNDITFSVYEGDVLGLIGPNGSGKTTLLSIITGLLKPSKGSVCLSESHRFGAMIEAPSFYGHLTAKQNLSVIGSIKQLPNPDYNNIVSIVGMKDILRSNKRFKNYSYGMKQRLGIAGSLIGNPELIILDEPTNGLDPKGIKYIREMINQLNKKGKTILVSSHNLSEINILCNRVMILYQGVIKFIGTKEDFLKGTDPTDVKNLEDSLLSYLK